MALSCERDLVALRTATDVPTAPVSAIQPTRPAPPLHRNAAQTRRGSNASAPAVALSLRKGYTRL
ncbi:hypothetical protein [Ralstonia sp. 1B3]|uniref:hypothetical protein n=1 Tax=Ralstonia sp. 1B3 TaxID=2997421 RepID=UPI002FC9B8B9